MDVRITEFLSAFYPGEDDEIRFRGFAPKGYPRWNQEGEKPFGEINPVEFTVTRHALASDKGLQKLVKDCNVLRGMYFVVNAGISEAKRLPIGRYAHSGSKKHSIPTQYVEDSDITHFNAFFCEDDSRPIEKQLLRIRHCPLLPPIMVLTRRSVHPYWPIEGDCKEAEWRDVQNRLIAYFGGDESIKNPSRVMRMPILNHISYDAGTGRMDYKRVEIYRFDPSARFTVEQMQGAFPAVQENPLPADQHPKGGEYPDWESLGNELRRRMAAHPTAHRQGDKIVLQGVCHGGKGNSALFLNTVTGKYHCDKPGCRKEDILRAFNLPERPTSERWKFTGRITPQTARAVRITDQKWEDDPQVSGLMERLKATATRPREDHGIAVDLLDELTSGGAVKVGNCADCGTLDRLSGNYCEVCKELRRFLSNGLLCGHEDARRWRYRDGGFKWHCGVCETAPADAVWSI